MLKASGLKKSYRSLPVLKGVHLEVEKGSIVAIVGASGAGKSTLLHILGSLDTPDEGEVKINDQNLFAQSSRALSEFRNKHLGFVFQFHNLLPEFTAVENVMIPGLIGKGDSKQVQARAMDLLSSLNLKERAHHKPSELSGGEQQRVAIARALVRQPSLLLADEPTGDLDERNAVAVFELMQRLHREHHLTSILATHNTVLAGRADRVLQLEHGVLLPRMNGNQNPEVSPRGEMS